MEDGYHVVEFPDGGRFEGEIKDGMPNGLGMMIFPSGACYKGGFKDAGFHGLGVLYFADGDRSGVERKEGEFSDDVFQTGIQWTLGDPLYFENGVYVISFPSTLIDENARKQKIENAREKALLATNHILELI